MYFFIIDASIVLIKGMLLFMEHIGIINYNSLKTHLNNDKK